MILVILEWFLKWYPSGSFYVIVILGQIQGDSQTILLCYSQAILEQILVILKWFLVILDDLKWFLNNSQVILADS